MSARDALGGGFGVALVTPFAGDGSIDDDALAALVGEVVAGGADFVVALGSTGEAAMLDEAERDHVVRIVAAHRGAAKLLVGAGAASTRQSCTWSAAAAELGADGLLIAVPPYVKPTQAGIVEHFAGIADVAMGLPIVAYNVPSRAGVNLTPATVRELWRLPSVVALKESSGDLLQITRIAAELPDDRLLLAGDDALLLPTIAVGGHGVVSVAGNVVPAAMRALVDAAIAGDLPGAQRLLRDLLPLLDALCLEPNPIPIKAALALAGRIDSTPRLPLTPATAATRAALGPALRRTRDLTTHG